MLITWKISLLIFIEIQIFPHDFPVIYILVRKSKTLFLLIHKGQMNFVIKKWSLSNN